MYIMINMIENMVLCDHFSISTDLSIDVRSFKREITKQVDELYCFSSILRQCRPQAPQQRHKGGLFSL